MMQRMKQLVVKIVYLVGGLLLLIVFILNNSVLRAKAANIAGGSCGDSLTWSLDDQGTLVIEGKGKMDEDGLWYGGYWSEYKDDIKKVVIKKGAANIGRSAFSKCRNLTSVIIANSVESIDIAAFQSCESLENITLPSKLTDIGMYAFNECSSLTSLIIPDNVIEIGGYAFRNCAMLTDLTLGNKLKKIGECAFERCTSLKSVIIPDSVTELGTDGAAFPYCSNLERIIIGSRVKRIGRSSFKKCTTLTEIYFCGDAPEFGDKQIDNVFEDVVAIAYYQKGNDTWKAYNLTNHNGTITWKKWDVPIDHGIVILKPINITSRGVQLSWSKVISAEGYYIYRKKENGKWLKVKTILKTSILKWKDTSIKRGVKYTYKIYGYKKNRTSHVSNERYIYT